MLGCSGASDQPSPPVCLAPFNRRVALLDAFGQRIAREPGDAQPRVVEPRPARLLGGATQTSAGDWVVRPWSRSAESRQQTPSGTRACRAKFIRDSGGSLTVLAGSTRSRRRAEPEAAVAVTKGRQASSIPP